MKPKLLSYTNAKANKSVDFGWLNFMLYLAPNDLSGYNVCPSASPECIKVCLNHSGYGMYERTQKSRVLKTIQYIKNRQSFLEKLDRDVVRCVKYTILKKDLKPCFRFDGTSDLFIAQHFLEKYPNVQFYDYTKVYSRLEKSLAYKNYHLTFSYSGRNIVDCKKALARGFNVAVSFKDCLPDKLWGYSVIDGDKHDLRFLDPGPCIIGLKPKGPRAKRIDNAFFMAVDKL
tara:strand:- start:527 stop:1216 length:690 start_codon:yes stop_codon:yes gene_type:complete